MASRKVGFIGLGRMGRGMARNLLKSTGQLWVYDVSQDALQALVDDGASPCDSPAQAAGQCDVIVLCLPFAPEVRSASRSRRLRSASI